MIGANLDTALRALSFIAPDERDTWIRMGMALKAEFGDAARDGWLDWSSAATSFNVGAAQASWKSFKNGGKVGVGTLFAEAKTAGFAFTADEVQVSPEQLAQRQRERTVRDAQAEKERRRRASAAAKRAQTQWILAAEQGDSPYLVRKGVTGEACRYLADGAIIIPLLRYDTEPATLVGKQQINADGSKKYSGGMDRSGSACRLGAAPVDGDLIRICEGYATGLSVRMADGATSVFVAFDTTGLMSAAKIVRARYPASAIVFCADDDYLTGGAGLAKAQEAAAAIGHAAVALPRFTAPRRVTKADETLPRLTDFNDLHAAEGLDAVRLQLAAVSTDKECLTVAAVAEPSAFPVPADQYDAAAVPPWLDAELRAAENPPAPPGLTAAPEVMGFVSLEWALSHCALVQGSTDVWDALNKIRMKRPAFVSMVGKESARFWEAHANRRTISPRNLPKLSRGVAIQTGERGDDALLGMLERYTFLYGTKTVWDGEKGLMINYDALALARGGDLAARWLAHPLHREIDFENLVFDPTQQVDLDTHINMFEGFPLKPKADEDMAELVLDLLWSLCASEENHEEVFRWVLSWLAYPLQHPGAKMQSALLFFGEKQGTGKSLFFEGIIKPIYGSHGATGGQNQLESTYTVWRSQKLFVLFEEILSRQDKYSYFGLVKHMITGRDTPISQKFKDDRVEANHMNCVMLSNEFQPVPLEPEDRRFLVVDVRTPLDDDLLTRIKAVLGDGLIEAFYALLLEYPLGEFNPHTKPIMTPSKQRVINFGRPDWEAFYLAWSAEELDAPYCSCISEDLHQVYAKYCSRYGFRALSLTKFSELIAQRVPKSRQWVTLGMKPKKQRTVFTVPQPDDATPEPLSKQCERFRNLADIKEAA